jgi:hypothetical protein
MISKEKVEWFPFQNKKEKLKKKWKLMLEVARNLYHFPILCVWVGQSIFLFLCAMNYHYLIPSAPNFIMFNQFPLVNTTKNVIIT